MCTVSLIANPFELIITSNRDETLHRPAALKPDWHTIQGKELWFPQDAKSLGTWFACSKQAEVFVLLNGARFKHQKAAFYRKSRGLVLLDIAASINPIQTWFTIDLEGIEPFTLIGWIKGAAYQFRWNGIEKEYYPLNSNQAFLWSSATLYSSDEQEQRRMAFFDFVNKKGLSPSAQEVFDFHGRKNHELPADTYLIQRQDAMHTQSITQVHLSADGLSLKYADLLQYSTEQVQLQFNELVYS